MTMIYFNVETNKMLLKVTYLVNIFIFRLVAIKISNTLFKGKIKKIKDRAKV